MHTFIITKTVSVEFTGEKVTFENPSPVIDTIPVGTDLNIIGHMSDDILKVSNAQGNAFYNIAKADWDNKTIVKDSINIG